ncbi:MAG: AsmA family protein, partial [Acetobacteraceae bacterium]|nr:AsmA family protein [Acetobacteraceae bacterium]
DAVLTAGALRLGGNVTARLRDGPVRVTAQISAESLPLPRPPPRSSDPLPLDALRGWNAAIALQAKQVLFGLVPTLADARASVALQDGTLRLDAVKANLSGGVIEGTAALETAPDLPHLAVQGSVSGAQISGPLFGTPLDVRSGLASAQVNVAAKGYSPAALLSTLSGEATATLRDGAVTGFDLTGADAALSAADTARRDSLARAAVQGGTTAFSTLDLAAHLQDGTATLTTARLTGPGGTATASGSVDLHASLLDIRLALRPGEPPDAPELAVSLHGSAAAPSRTPNLSDFVRWSLAQPTQ